MTTTFTDARKLERLLTILPDKVYRRVVRKAVNKSTTGMLKAARKLAPASEPSDSDPDAGQKFYRKSLGKKLKSYFKNGVVVSIVGARVQGKTKEHGNLSYILEHGHRVVTGGTTARIGGRRKGKVDASRAGKGRTGTGTVAGRVRGTPHLGPAFRTQVASAAVAMQHDLRRGIESEAKKL